MDSNTAREHLPCPDCGSHDALTIYEDGHSYCFSCNAYKRSATQEQKVSVECRATKTIDPNTLMCQPITARMLTQETCAKYGYYTGLVHGEPAQIACYYNNSGTLIGQKIRFKDKRFEVMGSISTTFFGQHLFQGGGKKLVITEGEIDCLTVSQIQGNKYPVVSIPNGAQSARKLFKANFDWLESFEEVIVMFDMDEAGRQGIKQVVDILSPKRLKIATLPLKDPNECLLNNKADEIIKAIWNAKTYTPASIVNGTDMWDVLSKQDKEEEGLALPWDIDLQKMTQGLRKGELVTVTAGTGTGKTTFVNEIAHYFGIVHHKKIGMLMLEENIKHTANALLSVHLGKRITINKSSVSAADYKKAFDETLGTGNFIFYDHFGSIESEDLLHTIRYMVTGEGCDFIILDHISIAVSGLDIDNERKAIDVLMTRLRSLVEETGVGMIVVSHLKRVDGVPAEEGGFISLSHLRGSQAISQLSDSIWGLERNQQDDGLKKNLIRLRVLKNRYTGETGIAGYLAFNKDTGRLDKVDCPADYMTIDLDEDGDGKSPF